MNAARFQLLPPLTEEERSALRDDIAKHGVQQPIVVDEHGTVIDGHHRLAIAEELGVSCPRSVYPGYSEEQKRSLALRLNIHRRQLTRDQRDSLIAMLRSQGMTQEQIAKETGVPRSTVRDILNGETANQDLPETIVNSRGQERPARYDRHPQSADDDDFVYPIDPDDPELADDDIANPFRDAERIDDDEEPTPQPEWQPHKPDLGGGVSHPARYSPQLVDEFRKILTKWGVPGDNILDPFAGTGRVHELQDDGWQTVGIELEPEWAELHPDTKVGSALALPFDPESFGAIVTSPTYGNRLADHHNASDPERRRSYTHDLGRDLHAENSGSLQWRNGTGGNEEYCTFHEQAWDEAVLVLRPGGLFVLNMCDHVRGWLVQPVTTWHTWCLGRLGLDWVETYTVPTQKLRQGENASLREQEYIHVFRKPW